MPCIHYSRIVDLSHVITPSIPLWPGDPAVTFEVWASQEQDGYYLRRFSLGEHSATHMNAPIRFTAMPSVSTGTPRSRWCDPPLSLIYGIACKPTPTM